MTKKFLPLLLALCLLLSGCTLAREDGGEETGMSQDRLIGAFITTEHLDLFGFEAYSQDNLNDVLDGGGLRGDTSACEGRIYAEKTGSGWDVEYSFRDLEGYAMFCPTINTGDPRENYVTSFVSAGVNDLKMGSKSVDSDIREQSLEGTIYLAEDVGVTTFYLNPVFQDREGNVYLVAGQGLSADFGMGSSAMTSDGEVTTTSDGVTTTFRGSVKVNFQSVPRPGEIVLLQMDADSAVLSRETYAPGTLPETLTPLADTAYILVETHSAGSVSREVVDRDTESLETFFLLPDAVCDKLRTELNWQ